MTDSEQKDGVTRAAQASPLILAIGSSTGGPIALVQLLKSLAGRIEVPIVITQHIAQGFSAGLAETLTQAYGAPVHEAKNDLVLHPGQAYLAPAGVHLTLINRAAGAFCRLDDGPAENYCKPSVNPMLRSVAKHFGARSLAVILTGMGRDGLEGCVEIKAKGGRVIAQDRASSAVWGMPRAVTEAGLCDAVLPLGIIGESIVKIFGGR